MKYVFGPFLQLLQKNFDTATDFAYDVGKIRSIYQNECLEKRSSISPGFARWSFLRIDKFQKSKKLFQKDESRKIQKLKKSKKIKNSKKKTQKCITKKIVDFSGLFYFFGFFELFFIFFGFFWVFVKNFRLFWIFWVFWDFWIFWDFWDFFENIYVFHVFWIFWNFSISFSNFKSFWKIWNFKTHIYNTYHTYTYTYTCLKRIHMIYINKTYVVQWWWSGWNLEVKRARMRAI